MDQQEFNAAARQYSEELLRMYRTQGNTDVSPPPVRDTPPPQSDTSPVSAVPLPSEDSDADHSGAIRVRVTTAKGARPVSGATVIITKENADGTEELLSIQVTDISGEIPKVQVPSPPPSADQRNPAAFHYDAAVYAEGYYRERSRSIPVFPDIVSIQTFDLIPLPSGAEAEQAADGMTFYNPMPQD